MNNGTTFGQVVRERRNVLGLTQTELARRVGCAAITIRKIEANDLRPSVQMAELIAMALNVPEEEQLAFVRLARAEKATSPIPTPSPLPGEIGVADLSGRAIKGFELGERIGSGGFGVVYRALQPSIEREVAVKIILPRYANHPNFIRHFEAEAQHIARLEHPHIVPLYDYWREPNAAYLIMRLLRGGGGDIGQNRPLHSVGRRRRLGGQGGDHGRHLPVYRPPVGSAGWSAMNRGQAKQPPMTNCCRQPRYETKRRRQPSHKEHQDTVDGRNNSIDPVHE